MFVLSSHIEIGKLTFDFVTNVEIISSWKTGTDTAKITLPRKVWIKNGPKEDPAKDGILQHIKQGDRVTIKLGYDGDLRQEFEGFVSSIKPDVPLEIFCEDYMYYLKRVTVSENKKNISLEELVKFFVSDYDKERNKETDPAKRWPEIAVNVPQKTMIGSFTGKGKTISQALEDLKNEGIYSFFRGNTLHVGFQAEFARGEQYKFGFQENIISNDLTYRLTKDIKIKIHAISNMPNGDKIEVEVGDKDGNTQTMTRYNYDKERLEKAANDLLKSQKRDGYNGSFTTFGVRIEHGDTVLLVDDEYPERTEQAYEVDTVITTFGEKGFRRKITPGYRVRTEAQKE